MQVQFSMHLIMPTISLCSLLLQKETRVVFLSTMHAMPCHDEDAGKEEINVFYNHEKGGVDSHDQMCALYTAARKTNRWPMRIFYGMVDSSALNAYLIFTHNVPVFGEEARQAIKILERTVHIANCSSSETQTGGTSNTSRCEANHSHCGILPPAPPVVHNTTQACASGRKRSFICPRSKDKKYRFTCSRCHNSICKEHSKMVCTECQE